MLLPRFGVLLAVARFCPIEALFISTNTTAFNSSQTVSFPNSTSIFPNATSTVTDAASACNAEYVSYSLASKAYGSSAPYITKTVTNTYNYNQTVFSKETHDCTQKCDTICYAGNVSRTISLSSVSSENVITYSVHEDYPEPTPTCSIGFNDCLSLLTSYSAASTKWYSDKVSSITTAPQPIRPSCSACVSTSCTFQHAGMSLYYWPVTTSYSKDMCAWDPVNGQASTYVPDLNRTYVPTTTGPYAVVDGHTLYQGNVYLSIMEPYVYDNCGNSISRQNVGGDNVITIASTDLYSVRKYPHNLIPWSVNYADFIEPVPWSAYYGGRYCANNRPLCSVVMPGEYKPDMVMPPQMRNLDPAWASCAFDKYGLFDPPVALSTVPMFLSTTEAAPQPVSSDGPVGTPPAPGSLPPTAIPSATSVPTNDTPDPTPNPNPEPTPTSGGPGAPGTPVSPPVITVGPSIVTIDPTGGVVIAPGTTLSVGGPGVVISSTSISVGNSEVVIVSPATSTQIPIPPAPTTISIPGLTDPITLNPDGNVVIAPGTTISQGGPGIVISSTTFSIGASGLVVIAPLATATISLGAVGATITLPGFQQLLTMDSSGGLVIRPGTTLHMGDPALTFNGVTINMGSSKIDVESAGVHTAYSIPAVTTETVSVKVQVESALEGQKGESSGTSPLANPENTGGAAVTGTKKKGVAGRLAVNSLWTCTSVVTMAVMALMRL